MGLQTGALALSIATAIAADLIACFAVMRADGAHDHRRRGWLVSPMG